MAQFVAIDPKVEVNGQTVLSVVDGMGVFAGSAKQILQENGIDDPKPGEWYPQQAWLDSFKKIAESIGERTLFQIGMKIPENADFPPEIDNIEKALSAIDVAYHMNHRNGDIGNYKFTKTGDRSGVMVCDNPYPSDFDRGIIEAMAKKFRPKDSLSAPKVELDPNKETRKNGADSCTYNISW
jgi:hypothetical protein